MIIRWFVCPILPQTQIQNGGRNDLKDGGNNKAVSHVGSTKTLPMRMITGALKRFRRRWLLRFQISPAQCGRKTFYPFSSVDEEYLIRFQSETCVFKFLRRGVDGALINEHVEFPRVYLNLKNLKNIFRTRVMHICHLLVYLTIVSPICIWNWWRSPKWSKRFTLKKKN